MKRIVAVMAAGLFAVVLATTGQAEPVDSLYNLFKNSGKNNRLLIANQLFSQLDRQQFTDTLYQFSARDNTHMVNANVHYWMAEYYAYQAHYDQAVSSGRQALGEALHTSDKPFQADVYATLCNAYFRTGAFDKALQNLQKAYEIDLRLKDDKRISSDLNSFAAIYLAVKDPKPGIGYIEKAVSIERSLKRYATLAIRLGMASELYLADGQLEKALESAQEAYSLDVKMDRPDKAAVRQTQMAAVYLKMEHTAAARQQLQLAIPVLIKENNNNSLAIAYNLMGDLELAAGNMTGAQDYYNKALVLNIGSGNTYGQRTSERGLWQALRTSDPQAALQHLERYSALNDSIFKEETATQLSAFYVKYHADEIDQQNQRNRSNRLWTVLVGIIVLLMSIGALAYGRHKSQIAWHAKQELDRLRVLTEDSESITPSTEKPATPHISLKNKEFIDKFVNVVYAKMGKEELDLDSLSAAMDLSRKQLQTRVQAATGDSPKAYVLRLRLSKAARLLRSTDENVTVIAAKCGFQDLPHFSKVFKQQYGDTPTQYRRRMDAESST